MEIMCALAEIKQDLSLAHTHTNIVQYTHCDTREIVTHRQKQIESNWKYIKEAEFPNLLLLSLNLATCRGHKLTAK